MQKMTDKARMWLCPSDELDPVKTFECGQCFRWNAVGDGAYTGVASGRAATVTVSDGGAYIDSPQSDLPFWRSYFDLGTDYAAARRSVETGEYMRECAEFGGGIRILRQDGWEALCSFIISQCNNIPRIKGIVEKLCGLFGDPVPYGGRILRAFPTAERVAELSVGDLAPLRAGYRAPYIISAAGEVASGALDLRRTEELPAQEARARLMELTGVGAKVANCVVLFGLHKMDAFPIDVWMKRALQEHFPPDFDPASFGEYAGLAQQYIFYRARSEGTS